MNPQPLPERSLALRSRLPADTVDLLDGRDGRYSEWSAACTIATQAMNAGLTEDEFIQLVEDSDFAYAFATENGRDRSDRLRSRLLKVWDRVEQVWTPPLGSAADVRDKLAALSARVGESPWTGRTGSKDRAVALALVSWAHEVGVWTLDASTRELSVRAGVARATAGRSLDRLSALGLVRPDTNARASRNAQRWIINLGWTAKGQTEPHKPFPPITESCGLTMSLQGTGHPVFCGSALGQTSERVWLDLTEHGESTVAGVADRLGLNPKTVRRCLSKLASNQLVCSTDSRPARYWVDPSVDAEHLDKVADSYGALDWVERTSERYQRERDGYAEFLRQNQDEPIEVDPTPLVATAPADDDDQRRLLEESFLV